METDNSSAQPQVNGADLGGATSHEPDKGPGPRLSFSAVYGSDTHQIAWDSTSLRALKTCPRLYYQSIVLGYRPRGSSPHLKFGTEYNNALVTYHQHRTKGATHEEAVFMALRYAFEHTWDDVLGRPWASDEPTKNRETLIRTIVWYLDHNENDVLETMVMANGEPAMELSFRISIGASSALTGEDYILCGYLDRGVYMGDMPWITDFKTTKGQLSDRYFDQYTPDPQVSQYSFAGNIMFPQPISGIIIDAAQIGVTFSRFQRQAIPRSKAFLEEWANDTVEVIRRNEGYVENNYWPMNDTACNNYNGCDFRKVCSASPEIRLKILESNFERRIWDPLRVREI